MAQTKGSIGHVVSVCVMLVVCAYACTRANAEESFKVPFGQRQLFLDDYGVAKLTGLQRTMHQPEKKGPVVRPDQPWEASLQTRCAPQWDPQAKKYKLWMITSVYLKGTSPPQVDPNFGGVSYAESADGIHWTKPAMRQQPVWGSLENNFLCFETNSMENAVYHAEEPDPNRRFKSFLGALGRRPAASPDGMQWQRLPDVPEIPSGDESNMSYDRASGTFIATLKTDGLYGRAHKIWTSEDFKKWTDTGVVFHADQEDQRLAKTNIRARLADPALNQPIYHNPTDYNADIYNLGIFRYEGLCVGLPAVFHATGKLPSGENDDGFHLIQLMCSRDLRDWKRLGGRKTFIGPSPVRKGTYDWTQLLPPSAPVSHGDELWFYYTGIKYRVPPASVEAGWGAVCLATLRRDGFISLDAGDEPGTVLSKPFVLPGTRLFVNTDADGGSLKVDVLDGARRPVAVSEFIVGDQLSAGVQWKSGDLVNLNGKTASLRFTLRKAKLYSFWFNE